MYPINHIKKKSIDPHYDQLVIWWENNNLLFSKQQIKKKCKSFIDRLT